MTDPRNPREAHESRERRDPAALLDHDDFLRALARSLVSDDARADDVVQQSYVAALTSSARSAGSSGATTSMHEASSLRAWLAGVVRHVAWKLHRSESRRDVHERAAARSEALPSVAEIVAREQTRRRVVEAVLKLDEPSRTTMLLRYFDRLPPRAIAKRLNEPVETVRSRIKRALERLRVELDREHGGDDDARAKWLAALAPFAKPAPLGPIAAIGAATTATVGSIASGVLLMSAKAKVLSTAAVLASATLAWVFLHGGQPDDSAKSRAAASDRSPELASPAVVDDVSSKSTPAEIDPSRLVESASKQTAPTNAPAALVVDPKFATLVVKAKWERDGKPAADVTLSLYVWARADHYLFLPEAKTDASGVAKFERIEPGAYLVLGDRSGQTRGSVEAGKTTEVELLMKDGVDVDGEVVDAKGQPVGGAAIWLGFDGNQSDNGSIVTQSDEHGRFAVASVTGDRNLGARKHGFAPSPLVVVQGRPGTTLHTKLVFEERGGRLTGRVLDPDDKPVADAIVQLGDEHKTVYRPASFPYELIMRTRSDVDGRFEFDGATTGEQPLVVRSRNLAPWVGKASVTADLATELVVHLPHGATLEGKVVDAKQQPAKDVTVTVEASSRLASTETTSDANGQFRCEHVLPASLSVRAELEGKSAKSRATFPFADGETTRWDFTLASGLTLRGRVVDENDRPIGGCFVDVMGTVPGGPGDGTRGDWYTANQTCDAEGRFVLEGCPPTIEQLRVEPAGGGMSSLAFLRNVQVTADELVVKVPSDHFCSVWFEGVVVDESGKPLDNATVTAFGRRASLAPIVQVEAHTGHFKSGPYSPDDYTIEVNAPGYATCNVAVGRVAKDERRDIGTIRLEHGSPITVRAHDSTGRVPDHLSIQVRAAGTERLVAWNTNGAGVATAERIAPGDYEVAVQAPGFVPAFKSVTVENDKPLDVDVELRPGHAVTIHATFTSLLRDTLASENSSPAWATLRDPEGKTLAHLFVGKLDGEERGTSAKPWSCELALLPGRHTLDLVVDGETQSSATFEVANNANSGATIDLTFD